jgi:aspartokinase
VIADGDVATARRVLGKGTGGATAKLSVDHQLGAVTLIGPGVGGEMAIVSRMLATLASRKIHLEGLVTSETRITAYVGRDKLERALTALHTTFIG